MSCSLSIEVCMGEEGKFKLSSWVSERNPFQSVTTSLKKVLKQMESWVRRNRNVKNCFPVFEYLEASASDTYARFAAFFSDLQVQVHRNDIMVLLVCEESVMQQWLFTLGPKKEERKSKT